MWPRAKPRTSLQGQAAALTAAFDRQNLPLLKQDDVAWSRIAARWRAAAASNEQLLLLDAAGQVLRDERHDGSATSHEAGARLALVHQTAAWGQFAPEISGDFSGDDGQQHVAVANLLASHDGYFAVARSLDSARIARNALMRIFATGSAITLVWVTCLSSAALFLLLGHLHPAQSAAANNAELSALRQAQALVRTQETVIFGLAKLSDSRDPDTGAHLERITQFSSMLAAGLRNHPQLGERITPDFIELIGISSALHDIGKVGVEDSILQKHGRLTPAERERMQLHTQIGDQCLREIERRLGPTNFLQMAREIVVSHHEWWDGQGYPNGLVGEQIPLSARIVSVADVYDALRSKRVYKEPLPHEECVRLIVAAAGKQFDPRVVEAFVQMEDRFRRLSDKACTAEPPGDSPKPNQPNLNCAGVN